MGHTLLCGDMLVGAGSRGVPDHNILRLGVCIDMRMDMCMDMRMDMCIDKCMGMCIDTDMTWTWTCA